MLKQHWQAHTKRYVRGMIFLFTKNTLGKENGGVSFVSSVRCCTHNHIFLRYCPPTWYRDIGDLTEEQYFTVSINSVNRLPLLMATVLSRSSISAHLCSLPLLEGQQVLYLLFFFFRRASDLLPAGIMVGLPFLLRKVLTLRSAIRRCV